MFIFFVTIGLRTTRNKSHVNKYSSIVEYFLFDGAQKWNNSNCIESIFIAFDMVYHFKLNFFHFCFGWIEKKHMLVYHLSFQIYFFMILLLLSARVRLWFFFLSLFNSRAVRSSLDFPTAWNEKFIFKTKISCESTVSIQQQCIKEYSWQPRWCNKQFTQRPFDSEICHSIASNDWFIFFVFNQIDTFDKMLWHVTLFLLPHTK